MSFKQDLITSKIIKELSIYTVVHLKLILNSILMLGTFLRGWKLSYIKMIPKRVKIIHLWFTFYFQWRNNWYLVYACVSKELKNSKTSIETSRFTNSISLAAASFLTVFRQTEVVDSIAWYNPWWDCYPLNLWPILCHFHNHLWSTWWNISSTS